jgi:hypothetical protein
VALVRTDVPEEHFASLIEVARIGELGTTLALRNQSRMIATDNVDPSSLILYNLMLEVISSSETSFFTRATLHHFREDGIHHNIWCLRIKGFIMN